MCLNCVHLVPWLRLYRERVFTLKRDLLGRAPGPLSVSINRLRHVIDVGANQLLNLAKGLEDELMTRDGVHLFKEAKTVDGFRSLLDGLEGLMSDVMLFGFGACLVRDRLRGWCSPDKLLAVEWASDVDVSKSSVLNELEDCDLTLRDAQWTTRKGPMLVLFYERGSPLRSKCRQTARLRHTVW